MASGKKINFKIPLQIKEPTPENEKSLSFDNHVTSINSQQYTQQQTTIPSTPCSRTKYHLMEVGGKISSFTMECSNRINRCATWLCGRSRNGSSDNQRSPGDDVVQGPGPSPGSTGTCDDSQPPPKNCYRLVMLG